MGSESEILSGTVYWVELDSVMANPHYGCLVGFSVAVYLRVETITFHSMRLLCLTNYDWSVSLGRISHLD